MKPSERCPAANAWFQTADFACVAFHQTHVRAEQRRTRERRHPRAAASAAAARSACPPRIIAEQHVEPERSPYASAPVSFEKQSSTPAAAASP